MNTKQKNRWILDAALFGGLILACFVGLTGVALHQWLGIVLGAGTLYHLFTHMDWMESVAERFFGKASSTARAYFVIDLALLLGFTLMVGTGLIISTWLGLSLANYAVWRNIHVAATIATLLVTALKLVLHRNWILQVARKFIFAPSRPVPAERLSPVPAAPVSRRAFLGMLGVVGAATAVAVGTSLNSLTNTVSADSGSAPTTTTGTTSTASEASTTAATTCQVVCNRRCSFPGQCRRYSDSNSNGRCDLGECA